MIVDDVVVTRGRPDGYLAALRGAPLHYVLLAPSREVVLERDRRRPDKSVAAQYLWLYDRRLIVRRNDRRDVTPSGPVRG